jgi:endoglucanase
MAGRRALSSSGFFTPNRALWAMLPLAAALAASACSSDTPATRPPSPDGPAGNPLAGLSFYVDPAGPAAMQAADSMAEGRAQDAAAMQRLAARPTAAWFADRSAVASRVRSLTRRAARADRTAVLVAYYVPGRDCGSYSAGGAPSAASYREWVRALARGIGNRPAVVILEPDAIPQAVTGCLSAAARAERYALLRFAVRTLAAHPRAVVYLDAGNPGWIKPPSRLVRPLRSAGAETADGVALNVSNFYRTATTLRYGLALSRALGKAHFVIDTSRNGNGPVRADDRGGPAWCNPPGRAVGKDPTTNTGQHLLDAYLWVKVPGVSDGACRPGAPRAGEWWPEYALELVRNRQ